MAEPQSDSDEYELLPHKEIEELKEELSKLKEFEIAPSKKLHVSLLELNTKLDKLLTIFGDAAHEMRVEEGGLSFIEKMKPLLEKMNKILEQNSEIASGILALADMVKEGRESEIKPIGMQEPNIPFPRGPMPGMPMMPPQRQMPPLANAPPLPSAPLPPLPKRKPFGL